MGKKKSHTTRKPGAPQPLSSVANDDAPSLATPTGVEQEPIPTENTNNVKNPLLRRAETKESEVSYDRPETPISGRSTIGAGKSLHFTRFVKVLLGFYIFVVIL